MSEVDIEDGFGESNEQLYLSDDQESGDYYLERNNECDYNNHVLVARKLTHFMPFRIPYTGHCNVNVYFDSMIEPSNKNDSNSENLVNSFRGRTFQGKKIIVDKENFGFQKINYTKKKGSSLGVNKVEEIEEYHIWRFDEEVLPDINLRNMSNLMKSLDILK